MGLAQSRQLAKQLSEACAQADNAGSTQVSSFLGDTFVNSAAEVVHDLERNRDDDVFSEKITGALEVLTRRRTQLKRKPPREAGNYRALKSTLTADTRITLPYDIKQCLILWKFNISTFFEDEEGLHFDPQQIFPGRAYKLLYHLERRLVIDRARRRILLTVLYKLLQIFGRERIKGEALRSLATAVHQSGLAGVDVGVIKENLVEWTNKGRRYSKLGDDLGGLGAIVLLPYDTGDGVWEHEVPMKSRVREQIIENLHQRGISVEASRKWNVPIPQADGRHVSSLESVQSIANNISDTMLETMLWAVRSRATTGSQEFSGCNFSSSRHSNLGAGTTRVSQGAQETSLALARISSNPQQEQQPKDLPSTMLHHRERSYPRFVSHPDSASENDGISTSGPQGCANGPPDLVEAEYQQNCESQPFSQTCEQQISSNLPILDNSTHRHSGQPFEVNNRGHPDQPATSETDIHLQSISTHGSRQILGDEHIRTSIAGPTSRLDNVLIASQPSCADSCYARSFPDPDGPFGNVDLTGADKNYASSFLDSDGAFGSERTMNADYYASSFPDPDRSLGGKPTMNINYASSFPDHDQNFNRGHLMDIDNNYGSTLTNVNIVSDA